MSVRLVFIAALALTAVSVALADEPNQRLSDAARGEQIYVRHCASCHGDSAAGDGPVAQALVGGVPDVRNTLTDDAMGTQVDIILSGKARMPAYSLSFDRYDARRVWRHMQRIAGQTPPAPEVEGG